MLLVSEGVKVARRMLMKLSPSVETGFINPIKIVLFQLFYIKGLLVKSVNVSCLSLTHLYGLCIVCLLILGSRDRNLL